MNDEKLKLVAKLDMLLMYHRLEIAAALKHPVMGPAFGKTLKDANPQVYRRAVALNQALEMDDESQD